MYNDVLFYFLIKTKFYTLHKMMKEFKKTKHGVCCRDEENVTRLPLWIKHVRHVSTIVRYIRRAKNWWLYNGNLCGTGETPIVCNVPTNPK